MSMEGRSVNQKLEKELDEAKKTIRTLQGPLEK